MPGSGAEATPVRQARLSLKQRGRSRADWCRRLFLCGDAYGGLSPAPARFPWLNVRSRNRSPPGRVLVDTQPLKDNAPRDRVHSGGGRGVDRPSRVRAPLTAVSRASARRLGGQEGSSRWASSTRRSLPRWRGDHGVELGGQMAAPAVGHPPQPEIQESRNPGIRGRSVPARPQPLGWWYLEAHHQEPTAMRVTAAAARPSPMRCTAPGRSPSTTRASSTVAAG